MDNKTTSQTQDNNNLLLTRILVSLGLLILIRIGTFIPVPGIEQSYLSNFIQNNAIAGFLNSFSGKDAFVIGVFTLNIFPYINASILMQLLTNTIPALEKLQKEDGTAGRREITKITRYITLGWAIIQSAGIALFLKNVLFNWNVELALQIIICLTTGSLIVMWLSELITEYGIGNGASLLIFTNIVSNLPNLTKSLFNSNTNVGTNIILILIVLLAISGIVVLQEGVRIVPLISSKQLRVNLTRFDTSDTADSNYIPLRLNQAGVMPIIFTATILVLPTYFVNLGLLGDLNLPILNQYGKYLYWVAYFGLVLGFSFFYSTIVLNPKDISKDLRKMGVAVPNIRPGASTTYYFTQTMKRITFIGAILLATITTLPNVIESLVNISNLKGLGTTSLLILVGVTIDTTREIRGVILSNIYKNMLK